MAAGLLVLACGTREVPVPCSAPQGELVEGPQRARRELWALHEQYAAYARLEADLVRRLRRYDSLEGSVDPEVLAAARARARAVLDGARAKLREIDDQRRAVAR